MIYGKATGSDLDLDQQRCDPEWLKRAMPEWFKIGNIREQHDARRAVGVATEHEIKEDGHYIKAHIVDPVAVAKTKAGVFTGLSIGIAKARLDKGADGEWIRDGAIYEVSLCDRPCLPTATFTMCKAAKPGMQVKAGDFDAQRLLVRCEEFIDKSVSPELKKADMTVTLADSLSPEQVERLEEIASDAAEKSTDGAPADVDGDVAGGGSVDGVVVSGCGCCDKCAKPGDGCCDMCGPDSAGAKVAEPELEKAEFDRDAALALVKSTLDKALAEASTVKVPPIMPPEELPDIMGAKAAIAIIAQLIQSEAADMVCAPNEDYDIECLMQAVQALRVFILREKGELGGDPNLMMLSATADVEKAKYTADELRAMLADGKAFKNPEGDPSYPIGDKADLSNAIHAVGRGSGDHDAIRAFIKKRAAALGASDLIPDSWTSSGSKAAEVEAVVATVINEDDLGKAVEVPAEELPVVEKAVELALEKVVGEEVAVEKAATVETSDPEALVKALTAALEKADNPLRKTFEAIVEAATETTAKSVSDLTERLVKVESMAVPGGPVLRRSEIDNKAAQKSDLLEQARRWELKAESVTDRDLQKGYSANAADLRRQAAAFSV